MHVTSLPQLACASWRWGTREQASFRTTSSSSTCPRRRYSVYLLYWYKSANTDASEAQLVDVQAVVETTLGTQFTSFNGTNVQIPTQKAAASGPHAACVLILIALLVQKLKY